LGLELTSVLGLALRRLATTEVRQHQTAKQHCDEPATQKAKNRGLIGPVSVGIGTDYLPS
jgi:hypothetical protein